jgi:hypothetical protein
MKLELLASLALGLSSASSPNVVEGWAVEPIEGPSQSACVAVSDYEDGSFLAFVLGDPLFRIGLSNPDWDLVENRAQQGRLRTSTRYSQEVLLQSRDAELLVIDFEYRGQFRDTNLYTALSQDDAIWIEAPGTKLGFRLDGADSALRLLDACSIEARQSTRDIDREADSLSDDEQRTLAALSELAGMIGLPIDPGFDAYPFEIETNDWIARVSPAAFVREEAFARRVVINTAVSSMPCRHFERLYHYVSAQRTASLTHIRCDDQDWIEILFCADAVGSCINTVVSARDDRADAAPLDRYASRWIAALQDHQR